MVTSVRIEGAATRCLGVRLYCTEQRHSKQVRLGKNEACYAKDFPVVLQYLVI